MKFCAILIATLLALTLELSAQPHPFIGLNSLPSDSAPVCTPPVYSGTFSASGFQNGDTVADFTLFDLNGDSVRFSAIISSGKPALLVAGSFTCPVFRGKINDLNAMDSLYAGLLDIFIIYTVEAHPIVDVSPYSGTVWVPSANYTDSVLFRQPVTYGERKAIADSMLTRYPMTVPLLIDGPCNEWWSIFGPAPNNAYLIDTNGIVVAKEPWFNKAPDNMFCSIDSLLGVISGQCTLYGNNGIFQFSLDSDSIAYGLPGQTLSIHCHLANTSATNNLTLDIIKRQETIPQDWQTALCADICYAPTVDSIRITLAPSSVHPFIFYFYSDSIPASGNTRLLFRNAFNGTNKHNQGFYGNTTATGLLSTEVPGRTFFPNPVHDVLYCNPPIEEPVLLFDLTGRKIMEWPGGNAFPVPTLPAGTYLVKSRSGTTQFLVVKY